MSIMPNLYINKYSQKIGSVRSLVVIVVVLFLFLLLLFLGGGGIYDRVQYGM